MKITKRVIFAMYGFVSVGMLLFMIKYSGVQEFWYDEIYQIGLVNGNQNFYELIQQYSQLKDYTPPLFATLAYVWIRIAPFSFRMLLLLPEVFTAAGIFFVGLAGHEIGGRKLGAMSQVFAVTSSVLVLAAGYEFRSYGLYFMAAALVFYLWCKKDTRFYVPAFTLLLYSHYYGAVILLAFFLVDVVLCIVQKKEAKSLWHYVVAGALFFPWMLLVLINHTRSLSEFWIQPPKLQELFDLFHYWCSDNEFVLCFLCMGIAVMFAGLLKGGEKRRVWLCCLSVMLGVPLCMYVYAVYLNPAGGIFYNRYFIGILPFVFCASAQGAVWLGSRMNNVRVVCIALFILFAIQNGDGFFDDIDKEMKISYTSSIKALSQKEDIEGEILVVTTDNSHVRSGIETYFEKLFGKSANIISQHDDMFVQEASKYKKIYLFIGKQSLEEETRKILSEYELLEKDKKHRIRIYQR